MAASSSKLARVLRTAARGLATVAAGFAHCSLGALACMAQSDAISASAPRFEVASIQPASSGAEEVGSIITPGGRLTIKNMALWQIVAEAFEAKARQLQRGTGPAFEARYDIEAKAQGDPSRPEVMAMLRTLLFERFQLKMRRETKVVPVYNLIAAGKGPKPVSSSAAEPTVRLHRIPPTSGSGMSYILTAQKISMERFSNSLISTVGRPVFDRTGLKGEFDLKLNYADEDDTDAPSLYKAIQAQLGLKLQPAKGRIEFLVMDHAERPSEN